MVVIEQRPMIVLMHNVYALLLTTAFWQVAIFDSEGTQVYLCIHCVM